MSLFTRPGSAFQLPNKSTKAGSKGLEDVARDIKMMVEKYHNKVEQETAVAVLIIN